MGTLAQNRREPVNCLDGGATVDDLREAVRTLDETEQTSRRVLGGAHPLTKDIEINLQVARATLRARETQPRSA